MLSGSPDEKLCHDLLRAGVTQVFTRTDIGGGSGTKNFYRITAEAP